MDAGDLSVFAAVAWAGGISKAARSLNTVQSNVTQRIRLLEQELGVSLFNRHSRGVSLTAAGTQLLPYAERIFHLLDEARLVASDSPMPHGRITIGALETATAIRLPPILASYGAACPDVDIEIRTGTSVELIDAVLAHKVEAAFVAGPVSHPELVALPFVTEELVVVTAPRIGGLEESARRARADKLKVIVFRPGCTYRMHLEKILAARGVVDIRRLEFGTLDGIIGCVAAGMGLTLLPRAVVRQAQADGRVALHALPSEEARVDTIVIRRKDAYVSTALDKFIALARDEVTLPPRRAPASSRPARKGTPRPSRRARRN